MSLKINNPRSISTNQTSSFKSSEYNLKIVKTTNSNEFQSKDFCISLTNENDLKKHYEVLTKTKDAEDNYLKLLKDWEEDKEIEQEASECNDRCSKNKDSGYVSDELSHNSILEVVEQTNNDDDLEADFQLIDEAEKSENLIKIRVFKHFCLRCGAGFKKKKSLKEHTKENKCILKHFLRKKKFVCRTCDKKKFKCKECFRSFVFKRNLFIHLRRHIGYRPYVCNICSKEYFTSKTLVAHKRIHLKMKNFKCKLCPAQFISEEICIKHEEMHNKKQLKCRFCKRTSEQVTNRIVHVREHVHEWSDMCDSCGRRFPNLRSLKRHMFRKHMILMEDSYISEEEIEELEPTISTDDYVCDSCGHRFSDTDSLKLHMLRKHTTFFESPDISEEDEEEEEPMWKDLTCKVRTSRPMQNVEEEEEEEEPMWKDLACKKRIYRPIQNVEEERMWKDLTCKKRTYRSMQKVTILKKVPIPSVKPKMLFFRSSAPKEKDPLSIADPLQVKDEDDDIILIP